MPIYAGSIIHRNSTFIIDRLQSAGPGEVNIPEEKIYEVGNFQTVATVYDTPELTFDMESLDLGSCETEAIICGQAPGATTAGERFEFLKSMPFHVVAPFKDARGVFTSVRGAAVPFLTLSSASYRFGVGQSSTQSFSLSGDAVYYTEGAPRHLVIPLVAATTSYPLGFTAVGAFVSGGNTQLVYDAFVRNPSTQDVKRLRYGVAGTGGDYIATATTVVLNTSQQELGYTELHVICAIATETIPQSDNADITVKPAAIRGKDIDVFIGGVRWTGVQSLEATWQAQLDPDRELGNPSDVSRGFDVPEVTGSLTLRPLSVAEFFARLHTITGVPGIQTMGPSITVPLPMEARVRHPDTGAVLKTLYVPDARFKVPGYAPNANSKTDFTLNFNSDGGLLDVFRGARP